MTNCKFLVIGVLVSIRSTFAPARSACVNYDLAYDASHSCAR
jgi:hypothetical protein